MAEPSESVTPGSERRSAAEQRRIRVIDAFIDLVLEGNLPPTSEQVAERSGVSMATLFRYFETLDELRQYASHRTLERFPLLRVPDVGQGALDARIERFASLRVELWEHIHLLARLQRSKALRDPGAAQMVDRGRLVMADQIREHFEPELRGLSPARRDDTVLTIASLTSVESWEQLRHAYGRSPSQTRRAWSRAIAQLLRDAG